MRSIQRRFKNIEDKNPYWSSLTSFSETIKNRGFSGQMIRRWFYKLVDQDDYDRKDKKAILFQLEELTKPVEQNKKSL